MLKFSLPIVVGQLGQMLITAGDVWIAGKHSTIAVAAIGVAGGIIGPILMIGMGILISVSSILSQKRGEGESVDHYLFSTVLFSIVVAIPWIVLCQICSYKIDFFGFNPEITPYVKDYLWLASFSLLGSSVFMGLKEYLQSFENTLFANGLSIFCIFLNLILNYTFVFGKFGSPEFGVIGLAYSTLIIRLFMAIVLLIYAIKISGFKFKLENEYIKKIIVVGSPVSFSFLLEVSAFSIVSLLIGKMATSIAAAHNIVLTLASTTFMLPLAISSAVSVKVGHSYGSKEFFKIKSWAKSALSISLIFMAITATSYILFPEIIIKIFSHDQEVLAAASSMLYLVALFQIFDGTQVTLAGVLRGMNITKPVFLGTVGGYWLVGMPIGYYLAFSKNLQQIGLWSGLALSLFCVAIFLSLYSFYKIKALDKQ